MNYLKDANLIIDGIIFGLQRTGGISRVWSTLLPQFISSSVNFRYIETNLAHQNKYRSDFKLVPDYIERQHKLSKFLSPRRINTPGIYIPTYYRPSDKKNRCIQICHDTIREESISKLMLPALKIRRRALYDQAEKIICISNATRSDLLKHYGESIYSKSIVIPNPLDSNRILKFAAKSSEWYFENIPRDVPIALYIGKRDGAKNFAYSKNLMSQTIKINLQLAVVGEPFSAEEEILLAPYRQRVFNLGALSDSVLVNAIAKADFLFLPSLKEGFGFPTVEALSLGTPVVCSDTVSNRETSLGFADYYQHGSDDALNAAVNSAIRRNRLKQSEISLIRTTYEPEKISHQYLSCINGLA